MRKKLTPKQDKFCQLYIENGGNASEAYRGSYNASNMKEHTINCKASVLLKQDEIAARIGQLQERHAERHNITIDFLTEKYLGLLMMAEKENKIEAGKGILDSLGKLHGLMVDKKQVNGNIQHNHTAEPVSESAGWIAGVLGRSEKNAPEISLPN